MKCPKEEVYINRDTCNVPKGIKGQNNEMYIYRCKNSHIASQKQFHTRWTNHTVRTTQTTDMK